METTTESIDTYRRAGRAIGREQGCTAAGVIFAGVCAEYMYRSQIGATGMDNPAETLIEVLCGDALGIRAGDELGIVASVRITNWVSVNWSIIEERAQLLADTPAADTAEESAYRTVATQMALIVADEHHVAVSVVAGAAAVARLRRHTSSDVEGSTEDQIAEMAQTDPALAAAWDELDETVRRGPGSWVVHRWGDICAAAEELASLTTVVEAPLRTDQRADIAKHEVKVWLAQFGVSEPAIAYAAAAAEGMVLWETCSSDPEMVDGYMDTIASVDAPGDNGMNDDVRAQCRQMIRDRWEQLAPPLRAR